MASPDGRGAWSARGEVLALASLGAPLFATSLSFAAMTSIDIFFVARVGTDALGAMALGTAVVSLVGTAIVPLFLALQTFIARAHAAGSDDGVGRTLAHGAMMAALASGAAAFVLCHAEAVIRAAPGAGAHPAALTASAGAYCRVLAYGIPFLYLQYACTFALRGMSRATPDLVVTLAVGLVNGVMDWALIFGKLGFAAHGLLGSAWSTNVARAFHAAVLVAFVVARGRVRIPDRPWRTVDRTWPRAICTGPFAGLLSWDGRLAEILRVGIPGGAMALFESSPVVLIAIWMARLGATAMAANEIVRNLVAIAVLVPNAVVQAMGIRIARSVGAGASAWAQRVRRLGLAVVAAYAICAALAFGLAPLRLVTLFGPAAPARDAAIALMPVAAAFVIASALRIAGVAALAAVLDTKVPMILAGAIHWAVTAPAAYALMLHTPWGARGAWIGQALGQALLAASLHARFRRASGDAAIHLRGR